MLFQIVSSQVRLSHTPEQGVNFKLTAPKQGINFKFSTPEQDGKLEIPVKHTRLFILKSPGNGKLRLLVL